MLFVEHTPDGELASRLRELLGRLAPTLGFEIKQKHELRKRWEQQDWEPGGHQGVLEM